MAAIVNSVEEDSTRYYVRVEGEYGHIDYVHVVRRKSYRNDTLEYFAILQDATTSPYPRAVEEARLRVAILAIEAVKEKYG